jgi:hypothetical protein
MKHAELKKLAEAATPGPWAVKEDVYDGPDEVYGRWHKVGDLLFIGENLNKDSAYIAAASPDVILGLLAEIAALLEALKLAQESMGAFVSDQGWSQSDMDNFDTVCAAIAKAEGRTV